VTWGQAKSTEVVDWKAYADVLEGKLRAINWSTNPTDSFLMLKQPLTTTRPGSRRFIVKAK
jgi:hypothetical protein